MKYNFTALTVAIFIFHFTNFAQQSLNVDSLRSVIKKSANADDVLKACVYLSGQMNLKSFDENLEYATIGLQIAETKKDSVSIGRLLHNTGIGFYFKGKFDRGFTKIIRFCDSISPVIKKKE